MRAEAETEAEKDIFKLMNNSLFGKSCENPLMFLEAKILTDDYEIPKAVSKPTCKDVIRYDTLIEFFKKKYDMINQYTWAQHYYNSACMNSFLMYYNHHSKN